MQRLALAVITGALLLGAAASGDTTTQADPVGTPPAENVFAETSFAWIIAKVPNGIEAKNMTYAIHEPRLVSIGGRWFVMGKPVRDENKPAHQFVSKIGIAWEHVIEFSLFTQEQFKEFNEERQANAGQ